MAALTAPQATITGTTVTDVAASAGGDTVPTGSCALITNGGASPVTVTIADPGLTPFGLANPDPTVVVPNGAKRLIGPFATNLADAADGRVHLTYSGVTSLTVTVLRA